MTRIYAGMLGLVAFLTCLARGIVHEWPAEKSLLVAWTSLLAFAALGSIIGWIAERILEEEARARIAAGSDDAKPASRAQATP